MAPTIEKTTPKPKFTDTHEGRDIGAECGLDGWAVEAQVRAELRTCSYHPVRSVSCEVRGSVLSLRGRVPSYYMKQIAQTIVRHLLKDTVVINNELEVDGTD